MDYLINLSANLGGKIKSQDILDINFKEIAHRISIIKDYKGIKLEIIDHGILYAIGIKIESDFFFSINNPEKVLSIKYPISVSDFDFKIYIKNEINNPFLSDKFQKFWKIFKNEIIKLDLSPEESIFIYKDQIVLVLKPERDLSNIINNIVNIINAQSEVFRKPGIKKITSKNVPVDLKPLLPLLKRWAFSDDLKRQELIDNTSKAQKRKLISTVEPYFNKINSFLDSFEDRPLTYEATLIGNLAELVSELDFNPSE